jgi:hypothetical protein
MMRIFVRIALGITISMFSMTVVAKEPLNDQEKNTHVHDQSPEPSKKPPKIILDNPPAKAVSKESAINAGTIKEKAGTEIHVNPCNGSTPPSWC